MKLYHQQEEQLDELERLHNRNVILMQRTLAWFQQLNRKLKKNVCFERMVNTTRKSRHDKTVYSSRFNHARQGKNLSGKRANTSHFGKIYHGNQGARSKCVRFNYEHISASNPGYHKFSRKRNY